VRISRFRLWDLSRVLEIERAVFGAGAYSRGMFLELYRDCGGLFFVAKCSGRIAGYVVTCAGRKKAEIVSVAVRPDRRGRGIGGALMANTLQALEDTAVERVELTVRTTNQAAIRFYRGFGFVSGPVASGYYEDGEDGLRMWRQITAKAEKTHRNPRRRP
jgi:ribosomal-protein-alanine N-acetyltransferase